LKRLSLGAGAIALAISAGPALASDLPSSREPPPPPPYFAPAPVSNWSGFYVGLNAGGAFGGDNNIHVTTGALSSNVDAAALSATGSGTGDGNFGGFIGGGEIGYNWRLAPTIVAGAEADIQGVAGGGGDASFASAAPGVLAPGHAFRGAVTVSRSLDYLGTLRGRVGYLATPSLLLYATGGLAYGGTSLSSSFLGTETNGAGVLVGESYIGSAASSTHVGWTAGAGLEWMFARSWSAKVEYLYYDLGWVSIGGPLQLYSERGTGHGASQTSAQFNGHVVRAGLNYHFGSASPAPIIAKY
jgi:outer membrane immunogenic protein